MALAYWLAVTFVVAATTPGMAQTSAAEQAGEAWQSCLAQQAARLDDGTSDPKLIASAVLAGCVAELHALVRTQNLTSGEAEMTYQMITADPTYAGRGLMAVLDERRKRRLDPGDFNGRVMTYNACIKQPNITQANVTAICGARPQK